MLEECIGAWASPTPELLASTPPEGRLHHTIRTVPVLPSWSTGRVALLGDAAHAMVPNLGQGGAQAIEDAIGLAKAVADEPVDIARALVAYGRARRRRAIFVQRASLRMSRLAMLRGTRGRARNAVLRHAPAATRRRVLDKVVRPLYPWPEVGWGLGSRKLELQPLTRHHLDALLRFEVENRAYFGRTISDRGDEFFAAFPEHHDASLAQQAAGVCAFYVLVDDKTGVVVGRFNLYDVEQGAANVGYRVAEGVAGRGVATQALRDLCRRAADEHGLKRLNAEVSRANVASQRVLEKAGFTVQSECVVAGKPGIRFALPLRAGPADLTRLQGR